MWLISEDVGFVDAVSGQAFPQHCMIFRTGEVSKLSAGKPAYQELMTMLC